MDLNEALQLVNRSVRDLTTYHLEPIPTRIKLNQNENPSDWPAEIKDEIAAFCRERPWNRYPNFVPDGLKQKLAEYAGHSADGILVGNGSNEMLLALMIAFINSREGAILCPPTFSVYQLLVRGLGGTMTTVLLNNDMTFDVDGIMKAIVRQPKALLILCSPNNPTGSTLDESQLRRILEAHRGAVILDQAYVEFGGFNAVGLLGAYPNLLITRTFSKALAGAGLRLGYLLGHPKVIHEINKVKLPYNINFFVEHTAETLLSHMDFVRHRVAEIIEEREKLFAFFKEMPLENAYPSKGNFLLIRCARKNELFSFLTRSDILVRDVSGYPMLENCLRINPGTTEENRELKKAMKDFFSRPA